MIFLYNALICVRFSDVCLHQCAPPASRWLRGSRFPFRGVRRRSRVGPGHPGRGAVGPSISAEPSHCSARTSARRPRPPAACRGQRHYGRQDARHTGQGAPQDAQHSRADQPRPATIGLGASNAQITTCGEGDHSRLSPKRCAQDGRTVTLSALKMTFCT